MDTFPDEYSLAFAIIETTVLGASVYKDVTDNEFEQLYRAMKKRPDGKSEGVMHDLVYQAAALMLGMQALSQLEFEAIFGRLAQSASLWSEGYISLNYITHLKEMFGSAMEE